jgi:hypothetical protein
MILHIQSPFISTASSAFLTITYVWYSNKGALRRPILPNRPGNDTEVYCPVDLGINLVDYLPARMYTSSPALVMY